jgi:hypothetical protein
MKNLLNHRSTVAIAFVAVLFLSSCGKKGEESATTQTPTSPVAATSPGVNKTTTTGATSKATLSAEAKKLGVLPTNETTCPKNAPVKGKTTVKRGNIYHVPKSPDYEKVKPDICFTDVATATKAGFRAPK